MCLADRIESEAGVGIRAPSETRGHDQLHQFKERQSTLVLVFGTKDGFHAMVRRVVPLEPATHCGRARFCKPSCLGDRIRLPRPKPVDGYDRSGLRTLSSLVA